MTLSIVNGRVVTERGVSEGASVMIEGTTIAGISPNLRDAGLVGADAVIDARGGYVLPGFIDAHVHGGAGADVSDGDADALATLCRYHAEHGTTGLLLTTRALPKAEIDALLPRLAAYAQAPDALGAKPLGIHLEGPFVSTAFRGAQHPDHLFPPRLDWMREWVRSSGDAIRIVTLAPELPGSEPVIRWLAERGIVVSAGHSGADYEQMLEAIECGVRHVTHCYNGMRGFSHRDPGMLAACMTDERVTAELILDALHVHPGAGKLLLHAKGIERTLLITDAIRAAGMPDGEYPSAGGRTVRVEGGAVRLPSGQLAGSTLTMNAAVRNAVRHLGATVSEAARMASLTPAELLGVAHRKGSIAAGKDADLVITDDAFNVRTVIREGGVIYQAGA